MKFGMKSYESLTEKDFAFKQAAKFSFASGCVTPQVYIGLPKWTDVNVIGKTVKEKDHQKEYVKLFNAVELNATHYNLFDEDTIKSWRQVAEGRDFLFCPKMFKGITHQGSLLNKSQLIKQFLANVSYFEGNLGPIFIQLNETFSPNRKSELFEFLALLPKNGFQFFLDLRHNGWFIDEAINAELFEHLSTCHIGSVMTDTLDQREFVHMQFPIPAVFIRFVCNGDQPLDIYRIQQWKKQFIYLAENGVRHLYFFLHIDDVFSRLRFAQYVQQQFT